jgi:hypothetical protein
MPPDPDETLDPELETEAEPKLAGAAATSALKKERKARAEAERDAKELRARFKKLEDAEKSENERLAARVQELEERDSERETAATRERDERTKRDVVRRAASEFSDPEDAIAHLLLRDELTEIEDESDAKRALKQLAKDKPYLLKTQTPQSPLDKVLQGGLPPGQDELNKALNDPSRPKTGDEMYAMSDDEFTAWKRTYPAAYRASLEGWTGNEVVAAPPTQTAVIRS